MYQVKNREVKFIDLGLKDYEEVWKMQEQLFADSVKIKVENRKLDNNQQQRTPNYLIFCEHPHVYTLGKSGDPKNILMRDSDFSEVNAKFYKINRGGDITYHGPGQVVGYPILDLDNFFTDIHKYLRYLEEAVINTLSNFKINAGRIDGWTGVWVDPENHESCRKICAIGVRTSRWVTMHGFALNVNTDLDYFNNIVPCGIEDKKVTSMAAELGRNIDIKEVQQLLRNHFADLFEITFI